jgi:hypothetical protein
MMLGQHINRDMTAYRLNGQVGLLASHCGVGFQLGSLVKLWSLVVLSMENWSLTPRVRREHLSKEDLFQYSRDSDYCNNEVLCRRPAHPSGCRAGEPRPG